jgi:aminoglycoside phosphotransferase (APT) family kinase protein/tetratricopeptide (TPR) repeat protein
MPIAPRFHRVAALQRPFVNREQVLSDFAAELTRIGTGPRVFNVTGVGGIGKSRLLRELERRARPQFRTAVIDLQVPALRRQDDALAVLRRQLGKQHVDFDRFDIAYAVFWQRLHPHLRLSREELSFVEYSSILGEILDHLTPLPVFGTAAGLVKLLERGSADVLRKRRIRRDPTLQVLDGLPNGELSDAVTYLFAEDLRAASASRQSVITVDSYDALVPAPAYSGRAQLADAWLRDLAGQLDQALVVIASRERVHWDAYDPDWASAITASALDGLPMAARLELLQAGGVSDPAERQLIADASAGLPFYLHLAVDTRQRTGGGIGGALVSQDEILARFLEHVAPEEIRSLEVLSPARIFDYDIFGTLTAAFHLPGDRLAWDSLTAYSFIYPAGDALRLHQLIRAAVLERLPAATVTQIHTLLSELWDDRARQGTGSASARACREAAYHGTRAGTVTAPGLLRYADQAVRRGGQGSAAGIADDLEEWLISQRGSAGADDAARALGCLRAEAAVRLGDTAAVAALTGNLPASTAAVDDLVAARLAVAAGHGQRIAGNTQPALGIFTHVWEHASGPPRLAAGLWAADLHMCQGRFRDAEELARQLEALAPADEKEFRGDVARLRHLTHRFAFDFDAARTYLNDAAACYRAADSVLGLANACTNRAELLALTSPAEAIAEASRAVDMQREIGAHHELGKAYTALGVAHLRRGELDQAQAALRSAFSSLDRAGYRSGRARAEFYQAALHMRRGRADEALSSLRWAVAELEDADVYPTLILCAARMLSLAGIADSAMTSAAHRAAPGVQPLGSRADLTARMGAFVDGLLGPGTWKPSDLYAEAAAQADSTSGYYNQNIKLTTRAGPVIVRIPIPESDTMDLAIWPEATVLRTIRGLVTHAPRLLYASEHPRFQIHEFIDGEQLDAFAPRGIPLPGHVIADIGEAFSQLGAVPRERIPPLPADWPADGKTAEFARRLSAIAAGVYERFLPEFGGLFTALGIPSDPLGLVQARWTTLQARPFRLLHTDLHRKNMILSRGRTYFLDWELALWGDPVYDLAVHLHKMGYSPSEYEAAQTAWLTAVPREASESWETDLDTYLTHERIKSAIVDTIRYTKTIVTGHTSGHSEAELLSKLSGKLEAARATGGNWPDRKCPGPDKIMSIIRDWAHKRPE